MSGWCQSCTAPLDNPAFKGSSDVYCKYCIDEKGNLKPREVVKQGIIQWFRGWHPNVTDEQLSDRAEHFMKAMPAWVDK